MKKLSHPTGNILIDDVLSAYLHINHVLEDILVYYEFLNDTPVGYIHNVITKNNESINEIKKIVLYDKKKYNG